PDGTFRILHTVLGAFHETRIGDRPVAYRDLSEVDVLSDQEIADLALPDGRRQRDFDRFTDWIESEASGRIRPADYFFRSPEASTNTLLPMFQLLEDDGRNLRWFEFDNGRSVPWRIDPDPLEGFSGSAPTAFQAAIAAWNNESHTPIRYNYAGTSGLTAGLQNFDGQNVLLFDDPNDEVEGDFSCSSGGTLAIGGPWYSTDTTGRYNGQTYIRIQGADIVINSGIGCYFQFSASPAKAVEELFGHELGHTLGLSHSSENRTETNTTLRNALMYYRVHDDGRGARLTSDDIDALRTLYDPSFSGGGGGGGGGNGSCPAGTLCLVDGRFRVTATWSNQFDGSSGSAGAIRNTDLAGFLYFTDRNNIELIVKVLDFGDRFLFFYGQLTNLRFTISVLDTVTGTTKTYQNTAGDCGAIDQNLAASDAFLGSVSEGGELAPMATCQPGATAACLVGGRFRVDLDWRNQFDGSTGVGRATKLSDLTAAFAFTDPANLELLVKVLDFPDRVLVLYGTLSNLEYTLRITEVATGVVRTYHNAPGNYCGGLDNNAF
ncbi:MAG: matrixin family metalloprotease, partial [Phycisphaerales bacterium]|nr:matrixin family metalloprotease [Phycisphaerales bacterium]